MQCFEDATSVPHNAIFSLHTAFFLFFFFVFCFSKRLKKRWCKTQGAWVALRISFFFLAFFFPSRRFFFLGIKSVAEDRSRIIFWVDV